MHHELAVNLKMTDTLSDWIPIEGIISYLTSCCLNYIKRGSRKFREKVRFLIPILLTLSAKEKSIIQTNKWL